MTNIIDQIKNVLRTQAVQGKTLNEAMEHAYETVGFDEVSEALQGRFQSKNLDQRPDQIRRALEQAWREGQKTYRLSSWVIRYTTAPSDYDWMGTEDLGIVAKDKKGKSWRKVRINPQYTETQVDRYFSGLHSGIDQVEFDKLLAYGLAVNE
jgi:hypothetical protein